MEVLVMAALTVPEWAVVALAGSLDLNWIILQDLLRRNQCNILYQYLILAAT